MTVLRLISGGNLHSPPRTPTDTLDLVEFGAYSDNNILLPYDGFSPISGQRDRVWRDQRLMEQTTDNARLVVRLNLRGTTVNHLEWLRYQIQKYLARAERYELHAVGEPIWLEHRWSPEALRTVSAPQVGQWSRYWRILTGEPLRWPGDVHGPQLAGGNVLGAEMELICSPYASGLQQQAFNIEGLPGVNSDLLMSLALDFSLGGTGEWTLGGWTAHVAASYTVCQMRVDANTWVHLYWDNSDGRFEVIRRSGGSSITYNGNSRSPNAGDALHLMLVGAAGSIKLYVNGALDITIGAAAAYTTGVTLYLGNNGAQTYTGRVDNLDAWRLWTETFTDAQVLALYDDEVPVKDAAGLIGQPFFGKTRLGDGVVDNCDDTNRDNYMQCGNVAGDRAAHTLITIAPPTSSPAIEYWLGLAWTDSNYDKSTLYIDLAGVASGVTSGGQFKQTSAASAEHSDTRSTDVELLDNKRYTLFARINQSSAATIAGFFDQGARNVSIRQTLDTISLDAVSGWRLFALGDIWTTPIGDADAGLFKVGVNYAAGSSVFFNTDYLFLLPYPNARLTLVGGSSMTVNAGEYISIEDRKSVLRGSGQSQQHYLFRYIGPRLDFEPGVYNTLYVLQDDALNDIDHEVGVTVAITPRWETSGGAVG